MVDTSSQHIPARIASIIDGGGFVTVRFAFSESLYCVYTVGLAWHYRQSELLVFGPQPEVYDRIMLGMADAYGNGLQFGDGAVLRGMHERRLVARDIGGDVARAFAPEAFRYLDARDRPCTFQQLAHADAKGRMPGAPGFTPTHDEPHLWRGFVAPQAGLALDADPAVMPLWPKSLTVSA